MHARAVLRRSWSSRPGDNRANGPMSKEQNAEVRVQLRVAAGSDSGPGSGSGSGSGSGTGSVRLRLGQGQDSVVVQGWVRVCVAVSVVF